MYLLGEQKFSYLIIGNGIAGVTAAEVLRAEDPQASIGLVADDPSPVYYRPALKDYLSGHIPTEKLWARRTSFYRETGVAFLPDHVVGLDSEQHMVLRQNHPPVYYSKLLLANGASPARLHCLGHNLHGVITLRTVTDYQNALKQIQSVRRVVISGSGTLALETAETLRQRGIEVTHLLRGTTLWSEVLDATASDLVLQEERRAGAEVCLEEEIVEITGKHGAVSGVSTTRGRQISCQMVIVAIGIEPNIKPWQAGGVSCGRGVLVDDMQHTNLPDIYAAGDLIETHNRLTNRTRLLGQWYPTIQQARIAAYGMLGRSHEVQPFGTQTFYNATFLYGLDFASAGLTIKPDLPGYHELVADPQPRSYRKVILKDGIPVGVLALGDRKQALALKRAIDSRVNLLSVANHLFSADFNLRAWLDEQASGKEATITIDSRQAQSAAAYTQMQSMETRTGPLQSPLVSNGTYSTQIQRMGTNTTPAQAPITSNGTIPMPIQRMGTTSPLQSPSMSNGSNPTQMQQMGTNSDPLQAPLTSNGTTPMQMQQMGNGTSPISATTTDHEALLVHIADPALPLRIAETPLNRVRGGQGQAGQGQAQSLRVGRQAGAHLLIDEGSVSRLHAEITYKAGQYLVRDLGSTNGTFVNEQPLDASRSYALQPNDILRFGNIVRMKFILRVLPYPALIKAGNNHSNGVLHPLTLTPLTDEHRNGNAQVEQLTTGLAILNRDGTLSTPGSIEPLQASVVEQLKQNPALVVVTEGSTRNGILPQIHFLHPDKHTTIGSTNDNDVVLTDKNVAPHHAEVFLDSNGYYIRDLGSGFSTLVNQTNVLASRHLLSHSDRIKLGSTRIFFVDLQAGKELTTKLAGVNGKAVVTTPLGTGPVPTGPLQQTSVTQNKTTQQLNVRICPRCGIANAHIARFCASCSTSL